MARQASKWRSWGWVVAGTLALGLAGQAEPPAVPIGSGRLAPLVNRGDWVASASSQEAGWAPALALEPAGRWSSSFADAQWWQVDFGKPELLGGLQLHWEDAYARAYAVLVSADGEDWSEVYATPAGKGRTELGGVGGGAPGSPRPRPRAR